MKKQNIEQGWKMRCAGEESFQEAKVPGSVYTDLLRNGQIEDPFFKDNEYQTKALMEHDFEYQVTFSFNKSEYADCDYLCLHFDGIDTLAEIRLNGEHLGDAYNMHRTWEYDVTKILRDGDNTLEVILHSPLKFLREAFEKYGNIGNDDTLEGFMHLRKAHYMMGWDWGACLPDAGIFRPVTLFGVKKARIDNVFIHQEHKADEVTLTLQMEVEIPDEGEDGLKKVCKIETKEASHLTYRVTICDPDGKQLMIKEAGEPIIIENPELWWPNGLGEQPLYEVKVELYEKDALLDTWTRKIGLRTLSIHREKDEWGESFAHEINGKCVFAMGADYIPEEHLLGRTSREKTYQLLLQCKRANFNTVRVWGGGYYPEDWFFDACDEMGLMVWQDFMFACSVYELTKEFEENIKKEFVDNIKRLRHHASLALWCGNNEMEMFVDQKCWVTKPTEVRDYLFMYERIIPEVLSVYDPDTFYWPASPSSGGSFDKPNDPNRGDVHYWEVWHGDKPFSEYRKYYFRYASEFGFQGFPAKKTLEQITDNPKDLNPYSYVMEKHQRNYGANGKISHYMQAAYLYPNSFELFIYASQLLQADAIRYGVEHYRRNRGRCMGAIVWQLNDCWPVISWSSIDYFGRWKALHYYEKRFFAPVMISCEEESWMTQKANMNRQHFHFEKSIRLNVANETLTEQRVFVRWAVRNSKAEILREEKCVIDVPMLSSVWLDKVELEEIDCFHEYVSFEALCEGKVVSEGTVIFSYPKYFCYEDPQLSVFVEGDEIVVKAQAYAKSVEILNEQEDLVLSDNYFDMNAGEKRVHILDGKPENLRVRSVYNIR